MRRQASRVGAGAPFVRRARHPWSVRPEPNSGRGGEPASPDPRPGGRTLSAGARQRCVVSLSGRSQTRGGASQPGEVGVPLVWVAPPCDDLRAPRLLTPKRYGPRCATTSVPNPFLGPHENRPERVYRRPGEAARETVGRERGASNPCQVSPIPHRPSTFAGGPHFYVGHPIYGSPRGELGFRSKRKSRPCGCRDRVGGGFTFIVESRHRTLRAFVCRWVRARRAH